jgi:hypothetical protein
MSTDDDDKRVEFLKSMRVDGDDKWNEFLESAELKELLDEEDYEDHMNALA